jgi:peptide-methionine (R)-S-oxide reductase
MKKEAKTTGSKDKWKKTLSPEQYHVLREKGTESPFSGRLLNNRTKGRYACAACGNLIFDSKTKFDSGCGWPSFYEAKKGSVKLSKDKSRGMERTEVTCTRCNSHLGHVFPDAPQTPTGNRYCINSVALDFKENEKERPGKKHKN